MGISKKGEIPQVSLQHVLSKRTGAKLLGQGSPGHSSCRTPSGASNGFCEDTVLQPNYTRCRLAGKMLVFSLSMF